MNKKTKAELTQALELLSEVTGILENINDDDLRDMLDDQIMAIEGIDAALYEALEPDPATK